MRGSPHPPARRVCRRLQEEGCCHRAADAPAATTLLLSVSASPAWGAGRPEALGLPRRVSQAGRRGDRTARLRGSAFGAAERTSALGFPLPLFLFPSSAESSSTWTWSVGSVGHGAGTTAQGTALGDASTAAGGSQPRSASSPASIMRKLFFILTIFKEPFYLE